MKPSSEFISSLLESLYAAAVSSTDWDRFLEQVAKFCGSERAYFLLAGHEHPCDVKLKINVSLDHATAYSQSVREHGFVLHKSCAAQNRQSTVLLDTAVVTVSEKILLRSIWDNGTFLNDSYICAAPTSGMLGMAAGFALERSQASGEFHEDAIELMTLLKPHMKRAALLHRKLIQRKGVCTTLGWFPLLFDVPVISLDQMGSVLEISDSAHAVLRQGGLQIKDSRLSACDRTEDTVLRELFAGAMTIDSRRSWSDAIIDTHTSQTGRGGDYTRGTSGLVGAALISRQSPLPPLRIVVISLRSDSESHSSSAPAVLLFLCDPSRRSFSRAALLRALHCLSPTEVRLVDQLSCGTKLKEAAATLRLTENTARFHLKEVFRKMGVNSQTALLRVILTMPGISEIA